MFSKRFNLLCFLTFTVTLLLLLNSSSLNFNNPKSFSTASIEIAQKNSLADIEKDSSNSLVKQTVGFTPLSKSANLFESKMYDSLYVMLINKLDSLTGDEMRYLGYMYLHGYGVKQNFKEARIWLEKSMASGNFIAVALLGYVYEKGLGVPVNYNQAAFFYTKSVQKNEPIGINNLGYLYEQGLGMKQDLSKAFDLYSQAAALGDELAINNVGWSLIHGLGTKRDPKRGFEMIRKAALTGNLRAMYNLSIAYMNGYGTVQNLQMASEWKIKSDSLRNEILYNSKF